MVIAREVRVFGLVQGVGFRPFLHRQAKAYSIRGRVFNRNDCVRLAIEGDESDLDEFVRSIEVSPPPLALVRRIETEEIPFENYEDFRIERSEDSSDRVTRVAPDSAVCGECLTDMKNQERRIRYGFTNCTNCGPRFTIVRALPYDRPLTTMSSFKMCSSCAKEYGDIDDRRYHAQPNACRICGPKFRLIVPPGQSPEMTDESSGTAALASAASVISDGGIVAIKGIGGYHLACDACNERSVRRLRYAKRRIGKPFAIMCRTKKSASRIARVTDADESLLESQRAPIVLLDSKANGEASAKLAPSVTMDLDTIGVMLPYAPVHHLLFELLSIDYIVMTSGNIVDEPIAITDRDAERRLLPLCDAVLAHNREIHNRADDSIVSVMRSAPRIVRRSRGWVPEPISVPMSVEGFAAVGGELKNTFCLGKSDEIIISQHIGDLKDPANLTFFEESFERLSDLFRFVPRCLACDLHPDYLSTRFAELQAETLGLPLVRVQHHHAHVAAAIAENDHRGKAIGVCFDGTGFGTDGTIWGGEFLVADLSGYERFASLLPIQLPGGDRVVSEPWRTALSLLFAAFDEEVPADVLDRIDVPDNELSMISEMIRREVSTPRSSGMGRLFDGVASLLGVVNECSFEAESPMRLESLLTSPLNRYRSTPYAYDISREADTSRIDWRPMIRQIVAEYGEGIHISEIAARFHHTIARIIVDQCSEVRVSQGINSVALTGGVFQNRHLTEYVESILEDSGFELLTQSVVPVNDGGLCLGQLVVATNKVP